MSDKMMRVAGRDTEGKARALKTDENGRLEITPQKGESEILVFSKDNPLAPRSAGDYEPRDINVRGHSFPHLITPYNQFPFNKGDYRNIFDQSFTISSTLDAELKVQLWVLETSADWNATPLFEVDLGNIPASNGSTPRTLVLTPEKTTKVITRSDVIELPELRQPYSSLQIRLMALTVPTQGEIKILNIRRY